MIKHLLKLANDFQLKIAQGSPEDRIRADSSLVSRLNSWGASNSTSMLNMSVQKGKLHEITFNDKKDPKKDRSFRSDFESAILGKAGSFQGWISLKLPLS